ncbi:rhodanese-like domain-containing protein [Tenacibaculum skagerrakense]|uniref:rhodanese-like domain-containing protein n=1 Tax=Tenacibaculum skagerrakense TaxID=186571 RepID=UPI00104F1A57|nr:rhodanese-like domain-containing protein [Tenacibaculum skagerrakense]
MKKIIFLIVLTSLNSFSQKNLKQLLKKFNQESVPYIHVENLNDKDENIVLLDAREPREFEVSHLNKAICVGYDHFDLQKTIQQLPEDKNNKIVVYCSLGIRSEDIAEQLKKAGYKNVFNLYGGIFEWKNKGNSVVNKNNKPTEEVHAFDKEWGVWLTKGIKIYE